MVVTSAAPTGGYSRGFERPSIALGDRHRCTRRRVGAATVSDAFLALEAIRRSGIPVPSDRAPGTYLITASGKNAELRDASLRSVIADNTTTWPHATSTEGLKRKGDTTQASVRAVTIPRDPAQICRGGRPAATMRCRTQITPLCTAAASDALSYL